MTRDGWPAQRKTVRVSKGQQQSVDFDLRGSRLRITSDPTGATVQGDGKNLGATPLELADVPPGAVTYTLQLAGDETATVSGAASQGAPLSLSAELNKKRSALRAGQ